MTERSNEDSGGLGASGDTTTGSPFIQKIEQLSDVGADVLALNTAVGFKMFCLIWQSLISSLFSETLNFVGKKGKRLQPAREKKRLVLP